MVRVRKTSSKGRGAYHQLVEYKRVDGKPHTIVHVHLGEHATVEEALQAWPERVEVLRRIDRDDQADKLAGKLERLRRFAE